MKVRVQKLNPEAVIPKYAKPGDAGLDLVAVSVEVDANLRQVTYGTGLAVEIPQGFVGLIFPRSSIRNNTLSLSNAVGVIDSGYRGEIKAVFNIVDGRTTTQKETRPFWDDSGSFEGYRDKHLKVPIEKIYGVGDKIAQLMIVPYPQIELVQAESLSETERGAGGFGSTGR